MAALPTYDRTLVRHIGCCLVAALVGLGASVDSRAAAWELREQVEVGEARVVLTADAFARSGAARLSLGCTAGGLLYASLDYVGYDTASSALRVAYRVDGRNEISTRWRVEPRDSELLLYSTSPVYLQELSRRVIDGSWLVLSVELLPPLRFSLSGSQDPVTQVLDHCGTDDASDEVPEDTMAEIGVNQPPAQRVTPEGAPTPLIPGR